MKRYRNFSCGNVIEKIYDEVEATKVQKMFMIDSRKFEKIENVKDTNESHNSQERKNYPHSSLFYSISIYVKILPHTMTKLL